MAAASRSNMKTHLLEAILSSVKSSKQVSYCRRLGRNGLPPWKVTSHVHYVEYFEKCVSRTKGHLGDVCNNQIFNSHPVRPVSFDCWTRTIFSPADPKQMLCRTSVGIMARKATAQHNFSASVLPSLQGVLVPVFSKPADVLNIWFWEINFQNLI